MNLLKLSLVLAIALLTSCHRERSDDGGEANSETANEALQKSLKFDENKAYAYIEKQVSFGPRNPSSANHELCANWILSELKLSTDTAYFQEFTAVTYDGKKHPCKNIIAKINPTNPDRILLSAHWDTRPIADNDQANQAQPILGADDGGSGVGVILAMLDRYKTKRPALGIDIVFFDIEDYGQPKNSALPPMENSWCLGSQYWAKNYAEAFRPRWGILLDMVGSKNARFAKEEISMLYAANLVNRVWNTAKVLGFGAYFTDKPLGTIQDDHMYINTLALIPTIDIITYDWNVNSFGSHWHTHSDGMGIIDKSTLKAVGLVLEYLIAEEDQIIQ